MTSLPRLRRRRPRVEGHLHRPRLCRGLGSLRRERPNVRLVKTSFFSFNSSPLPSHTHTKPFPCPSQGPLSNRFRSLTSDGSLFCDRLFGVFFWGSETSSFPLSYTVGHSPYLASTVLRDERGLPHFRPGSPDTKFRGVRSTGPSGSDPSFRSPTNRGRKSPRPGWRVVKVLVRLRSPAQLYLPWMRDPLLKDWTKDPRLRTTQDHILVPKDKKTTWKLTLQVWERGESLDL